LSPAIVETRATGLRVLVCAKWKRNEDLERELVYKLCARASADLGAAVMRQNLKSPALVRLASQSEMTLSHSDVLVQISAGQHSFRNCLGSYQS